MMIYKIGINPVRPTRGQKPNSLPNRKALDDIVFDIPDPANGFNHKRHCH